MLNSTCPFFVRPIDFGKCLLNSPSIPLWKKQGKSYVQGEVSPGI